MERVIVRESVEELGRFIDALREYLGLDPISRPHDQARARELDVIRFGAMTYPDPDDRHQRERGFT